MTPRRIGNRTASRLVTQSMAGGELAAQLARLATGRPRGRSGLRRAEASRAGAPALQRLVDDLGEEVTEDRITAENDPSVLRKWLSRLDHDDWEDQALEEPIQERLLVLEPSGNKQEEAKPEQRREETPEEVPRDPYAEVRLRLRKLTKIELANFLAICEHESLDALQIVDGLDRAASSPLAFSRAAAFFASGANFATALRLAAIYQPLIDLRMTSITAGIVEQYVQEGWLSISKVTYCDTPIRAGSVYVFSIVGTRDRLTPEWHVHWAPKNRVAAASFKDVRTKVGQGARVSTGDPDNQTLRQVIGSAWGP